jgi:hypothetical protein
LVDFVNLPLPPGACLTDRRAREHTATGGIVDILRKARGGCLTVRLEVWRRGDGSEMTSQFVGKRSRAKLAKSVNGPAMMRRQHPDGDP